MDLMDIFRSNIDKMSQSEVFRPSNGPLLVRGNLSDGLSNSADVFRKERPATQNSTRFGRMSYNSFFTRHNPHPGRVRHIKGLLDIPICAVNDNGYFANPRYSMNFPPNNDDDTKLGSYKAFMDRMPVNAINVNSQQHPINTITGLQYFMGKPLNFRVFREKAVPRMGMVPVTETWRDELRALTDAIGVSNSNLPKINDHATPVPRTSESQRAKRCTTSGGGRPRTSQYSTATGRLIPPPSRAMSRQASRQGRGRTGIMDQLEHITGDPDAESMVLQMLCQILQTDDVNAVQSWLVSAGDREKSLVLDMIRSALATSDDQNKPVVDKQYDEYKEYVDERSKAAFPNIYGIENVEGQVIGDSSGDLGKHIDRLSLMGDDPGERDVAKHPALANVQPIPEADEDIVKVHMSNVFRSKSQASNRPRSYSRAATPNKPSTPVYRTHSPTQSTTEPKLRYIDTSKDLKDCPHVQNE